MDRFGGNIIGNFGHIECAMCKERFPIEDLGVVKEVEEGFMD